MNRRFTVAVACSLAMAFCFFGMTQAAGDNMAPPGQPFQALQDQLDNEISPLLVPTGVISMSAGSLDDIPNQLLAAKGGKPDKPPSEESDYKVTDLGTLDGGKRSSSAARDISDPDTSDNVQVVGWSDDGQQTLATLWTVSAAGDMVVQPLKMLEDKTSSDAYAINQGGTMAAGHVGTIEEPVPVYWDLSNGSSEIHDLTPLDGFEYGIAYDVNDTGEIAGISEKFDGELPVYYATLWDKDHDATPLPPPPNGAKSRAQGINNQGDVVGMSWVWVEVDGELHYLHHAVLWWNNGDGYTACDLHVWDYDEFHRSLAYAITDRVNGSVDVTGERHLFSAGTVHPTVWTVAVHTCGENNITTRDLSLHAYAWDINLAGEVVGQDHSKAFVQPVVWSPENEKVVLPLLKKDSGSAEGINTDGQIVGWSTFRGKRHAVLWTKEEPTQ